VYRLDKRPSGSPIAIPIAYPTSRRRSVTSIASISEPSHSAAHRYSPTAAGDGSSTGDQRPLMTMPCHAASRARKNSVATR
jgi:hypothetical protein